MSASPIPQLTTRSKVLERLADTNAVDVIIIGGGATGLGIALDASLRGLSVALFESADFAGATSSRATKLAHGGVRYLAQGNISLVKEALHERNTMLRIAPHLVSPLPFVMPSYACWETPLYGVGLKAYDLLAGKYGLGPTRFLSASQVRYLMPGINSSGLKGGVMYWDAQFDDARMALAIARTAEQAGALLVNYCSVTNLVYENGKVTGVTCDDKQFGNTYTVRGRAVINATGVWVDALRKQDSAITGKSYQPLVSPSQGVHLVVDQSFMPGGHALLVPETTDGRVLFAVPWLGKLILGTTDTPRTDTPLEPTATDKEVEFIISEASRYLHKKPDKKSVKSIWAGLRPLVSMKTDNSSTSSISRNHFIEVSKSGLLTVTGGKWTTYRSTANDVLQYCARYGLLPMLPRCKTSTYLLVGAHNNKRKVSATPDYQVYGSEAGVVQKIAGGNNEIASGLTEAMVRFAVRHEYALTVSDVLARRSRLLFLDAHMALQAAEQVANIMSDEGINDPQLSEFHSLCANYQLISSTSNYAESN